MIPLVHLNTNNGGMGKYCKWDSSGNYTFGHTSLNNHFSVMGSSTERVLSRENKLERFACNVYHANSAMPCEGQQNGIQFFGGTGSDSLVASKMNGM